MSAFQNNLGMVMPHTNWLGKAFPKYQGKAAHIMYNDMNYNSNKNHTHSDLTPVFCSAGGALDQPLQQLPRDQNDSPPPTPRDFRVWGNYEATRSLHMHPCKRLHSALAQHDGWLKLRQDVEWDEDQLNSQHLEK